MAQQTFYSRQFLFTRLPLDIAIRAIESQRAVVQELLQGVDPKRALIEFTIAVRAHGSKTRSVFHIVMTSRGEAVIFRW
jgi:hypothetical protein